MSTAIAPLAPSLYELEQDLQAFIDTADLVSEESQDEFQREFAEALQRSVEKRDRAGQFLIHCQQQQENCDKEIDRLKARKRSFEVAEKRVRMYVQGVIESLGTDAKGRPRKLEGNTVTFSLRAKPPAVEITNDEAVPAKYKSITVTLPLHIWEALFSDCDESDPIWAEFKAAGVLGERCVIKKAIREALDAGEDVPGADLSIGGYSLVVK